MLRNAIHIILIKEANKFIMRTVEVKHRERDLDNVLMYVFNLGEYDLGKLIADFYFQFNNLGSIENRDLQDTLAKMHKKNHYNEMDDNIHRDHVYKYYQNDYELPLDEKELLMFLGAIDSAIHSYVFLFRESGDEYDKKTTKVVFYNTPVELSDQYGFCSKALLPTNEKPADIEKKPRLSRYIANWLYEELSQNPELKQSNQSLIDKLHSFLALESNSLTPAIRQYLYPRPTIADYINLYCKEADELTKSLLNPSTQPEEKMIKLLQFIKMKLSYKPKYPINESDTEALNIYKLAVKQSHNEISRWFDDLKVYQARIWNKFVTSLYGKSAFDGGFYSENYTEIDLLLQAELKLNAQGLMELHYLETNSYKHNYAPEKRLFKVLDKEVRQAASDLDLEFLPNQDFHVKAVFTADSSRFLKGMGLHLTKQCCKDALRKDILSKQFMFCGNGETVQPFQRLSKDLKQIIQNWVNIAANQDLLSVNDADGDEKLNIVKQFPIIM